MKHPDGIEISKLLDNELNIERGKKVNDHIAECNECRTLYEEYKNTKIKFREIEPPQLLFVRINESILNDKNQLLNLFWRFALNLTIIVIFVFSFILSLHQGKLHFNKETAFSNEQIGDEFILNISSYPEGSLSGVVFNIDK